MISGRCNGPMHAGAVEESPMRNVVWICAAVASALTLADARADGEGLVADANRVPWARVQSRIAAAPGAPGWRADFAPIERSGLQVGSIGFLGDVYFGSAKAERAPASGFRATSGVLVGARSPLLAGISSPTTGGLFASDRRLFGASGGAIVAPADPSLESATLPYLGIGYSSLSAKSGWHFSADLGVVSQSPGNVVRFGRVFGGSQSLDDVIREMRLAPVVQLGVSYSF
jgi:hypothetical protein